MGTITAKQLKQKTGEVIKRIKSGERLILTYRGKPLAVIEPAFDKTKKAVDQVKEFQKAWESITKQHLNLKIGGRQPGGFERDANFD
jgi:prevent-host-death family protein